jgi:hypothetical protein
MVINMINFSLTIHKLFFMHEWEIHESHRIKNYGRYTDIPKDIDMIHTLQCVTCGTLKRKKIEL